MSNEVAAGSGDVLEELRCELGMLRAQDEAGLSIEPSNDLVELLSAAVDHIGDLRSQLYSAWDEIAALKPKHKSVQPPDDLPF